jgi:hypothetical protein
MYTGTLIRDLIATVERVERGAHQRRIVDARIVDEMELRQMFELQLPRMHGEPVYAGAA